MPPKKAGAQTRQAVEGIFAQIDARLGVDDEEDHRRQAGQGRCERSAGDAHARQTAMAEDEQIVQHHIHHDHHDGIPREHGGLRDGHIEAAIEAGHGREEQAEHAPVEVGHGRGGHVGRLGDERHHPRCRPTREHKDHGSEKEQENEAVEEDFADGGVAAFAVAAAHDDLRAGGEAEAEDKNGNEIDAAERRRRQFHLAHTAEKGGIGEAHYLLHHHAQENGIGNLPDVAVGNGGGSHARGLVFSLAKAPSCSKAPFPILIGLKEKNYFFLAAFLSCLSMAF